MSVMARWLDITKAMIHEALDRLEKPETMLNHYVRSMQEEIAALEKALANEDAVQLRLRREVEYYAGLGDEHDRKARTAMAEGRTAQARQAVEAKLIALEKAAERMQALDLSATRVDELRERLASVREQYADMRDKRDDLAERASRIQSCENEREGSETSRAAATANAAARGFERIEEAIGLRERRLERERSAAQEAAAARERMIEEQLERMRTNS